MVKLVTEKMREESSASVMEEFCGSGTVRAAPPARGTIFTSPETSRM